MNEPFNAAAHRMVPEQRWFEDFRLGERFVLPSRTMTDAIFLAFQAASGDNHPVHYDVEYCRRHGMPHMLAHGFQVLIQTAAGAGLFPHLVEESLKAFIEQSSRFLAPVFVGDTLYGESVVRSRRLSASRPGQGVLELGHTARNQDGVVVATASRTMLVWTREAGERAAGAAGGPGSAAS